MRLHRDHFDNELQPLPADFEPSLREVDAHLSMLARRESIPQGLADRVFEASATYLPAAAARPRLRLVGAHIRVIHRTAWGQLALAASVMFAFVLIMQQMPVGVARQSNLPVVMNAVSSGQRATAWYAAESVDAVGREVGFLLDTSDVDSYDDLNRELAMLVADHDM